MVFEISDIPTILVIAGLIFIFLAIAGGIQGQIRAIIPPDKQKTLGIIGALLLFVGLVAPVTGIFSPSIPPIPTSTPTPSPIAITASPTLPPQPSANPTFNSIDVAEAFYPSGWLGDWGDITLNESWTENTHSKPTSIKISYSASKSQGEGWAGIYWQYPDKNWGDNPDGRNLSGATKLTFWARGERGGEKSEFKVGGITTGNYPDSIRIPVSTGTIIMSNEWKQYSIDLINKDLSHVIGGFVWGANKQQCPYGCTIYLDDIRYE